MYIEIDDGNLYWSISSNRQDDHAYGIRYCPYCGLHLLDGYQKVFYLYFKFRKIKV